MQGGFHLDRHAVTDHPLLHQIQRGHFVELGHQLALAIQDAAHIGEHHQIGADRLGNGGSRLIRVDVHQLAVGGDADGAHHRQEALSEDPRHQCRVARLAVTDRAECRIELGHLAQTAIRQTEPHRRDAGGDGLGHHLLVGGTGQRAGDKRDLLERGHPQTVLLGGGETQPLEQVIH